MGGRGGEGGVEGNVKQSFARSNQAKKYARLEVIIKIIYAKAEKYILPKNDEGKKYLHRRKRK